MSSVKSVPVEEKNLNPKLKKSKNIKIVTNKSFIQIILIQFWKQYSCLYVSKLQNAVLIEDIVNFPNTFKEGS